MTEQQMNTYGELFQKLQLTELCIEEEGMKLSMKKEVQVVPVLSNMAGTDITTSPEIFSTGVASGSCDSSIAFQKHGDEIKAPLLGIFHRAPAPNEPAFVEEGDAVKKGDVLCVIEAMKMMNEITAGRDGIIAAICAEENCIVEYGQKIFEIV